MRSAYPWETNKKHLRYAKRYIGGAFYAGLSELYALAQRTGDRKLNCLGLVAGAGHLRYIAAALDAEGSGAVRAGGNGLAANGYRRAGKRSAVFVGDDELNRLEDLTGHLDRAAGGDARGLRDGRGEALVRRRQRVAAALDVNGRLAVRVGDEGLCSGAALGIVRGEGDGRARDGQTEVIDHVRGQRVGRDVVDAQRRALALAHDEGEVGVGRAVLAELGDSGLAEGDGRAVYLVLPVLLERLAACADVLEGRAVRRVEGDGDVLIAAGRGVRVEIDRGGSDFIDRRGNP